MEELRYLRTNSYTNVVVRNFTTHTLVDSKDKNSIVRLLLSMFVVVQNKDFTHIRVSTPKDLFLLAYAYLISGVRHLYILHIFKTFRIVRSEKTKKVYFSIFFNKLPMRLPRITICITITRFH